MSQITLDEALREAMSYATDDPEDCGNCMMEGVEEVYRLLDYLKELGVKNVAGLRRLVEREDESNPAD